MQSPLSKDNLLYVSKTVHTLIYLIEKNQIVVVQTPTGLFVRKSASVRSPQFIPQRWSNSGINLETRIYLFASYLAFYSCSISYLSKWSLSSSLSALRKLIFIPRCWFQMLPDIQSSECIRSPKACSVSAGINRTGKNRLLFKMTPLVPPGSVLTASRNFSGKLLSACGHNSLSCKWPCSVFPR